MSYVKIITPLKKKAKLERRNADEIRANYLGL